MVNAKGLVGQGQVTTADAVTIADQTRYLVQRKSLALSPDDSSFPQCINDGIVHNCIWLAALLAHEVIGSEGPTPLPTFLICTDQRCEGDHIWNTPLLLHLLKQLGCAVALRSCSRMCFE